MDRCTHTSPLIDIQLKENENFYVQEINFTRNQ